MKTLLKISILTVIAAVVWGCESQRVITESQLPATARTFIKTHFPTATITTAMKEKDDLRTYYKAWLDNGFELEFTKSGDWDDVEGYLQAVPESVLALIPAKIVQYCQISFPAATITEVNKENYGYEIGLSNDIDIEFNKNGDIREID
ncbi:MAG: PepSY-like domain-containing protein [Prevotellaceae bacterium]|jgi:hypothetical protein|nr:PepSY-like domain-containing protein [Prevotellaceae bacterium]